MSVPYNLEPTARLQGLHMVGTVVRRFLISYPVDPKVLLQHLPPGAECATHAGKAWVSACFVRMDDMRPNLLPRFAGMGFHYLIHRTRARLPFPDGKLREAVLVLQPNINRWLLSTFGSRLTGVQFHTHPIQFTEEDESWRIQMHAGSESLYDVTISKSSCSDVIPNESQFATTTEADQFLLGVSFGAQWVPGESRLKLLPETHDPWQTQVCTCTTQRNRFLESLGVDAVEADHVITMSHIPHYFGITPIQSTLAVSPET